MRSPALGRYIDTNSTIEDAKYKDFIPSEIDPVLKLQDEMLQGAGPEPHVLEPKLEYADITHVRFSTDLVATADSVGSSNDPRIGQANPGCGLSLHVVPTEDSIYRRLPDIQKVEQKCRARRSALLKKLSGLRHPGPALLQASTPFQQRRHEQRCHPECTTNRCVAFLPLRASAPPLPFKESQPVPMSTDVQLLEALDAFHEMLGTVDLPSPKDYSLLQHAETRLKLSEEQNNQVFTFGRLVEYISMEMNKGQQCQPLEAPKLAPSLKYAVPFPSPEWHSHHNSELLGHPRRSNKELIPSCAHRELYEKDFA